MQVSTEMQSEDRQRFLAMRPVSRETLERLDVYAAELGRWQKAINLVGPKTMDSVWTRHFLDSLQLVDCLPAARRYVDLGSGAGFPGLILAVALADTTGAEVVLVESNAKKAAFLSHVATRLALPARVVVGRIEDKVPGLTAPDVVTARALAPLAQLLEWCEPLLKSGSVGLFPKGRDLDKELEEAARYWHIQCERTASLVERDSTILKVHSITRKL